MQEIRTWLAIPDLHYPFHDPRFIALITKIIGILKPDGVIQLGDFVDWYQVSTYDKDPSRLNDTFDDLCMYAGQLDEWESALPKGAEWRQLCGNHEDRLRRYVWQRAPQLQKMIKSIPDMLKFPERNKRGRMWRWFEHSNWKACKVGDVTFHHGHYYPINAAMKILQAYRCKMVTGHTHRVQFVSDGEIWAATLGHGSDEEATTHAPIKTGWQQAFGVVSIVQGKGSIEVVLVEKGACQFRGQWIKA